MEEHPPLHQQVPPVPSAPQTVPILVPNAHQYTYINASAIAMTQFDIRLSFAEILPPTVGNENPRVEPRAGIVMPVEHAALLFFNLMQLLASFEVHSGPIRFQPWRDFMDHSKDIMAQFQTAGTAPPTE